MAQTGAKPFGRYPYKKIKDTGHPYGGKLVWQWGAFNFNHEPRWGGVDRLYNGNTLISFPGASADGFRIIEVDHEGNIVWVMRPPAEPGKYSTSAQIFRAHRYTEGFLGLKGRNLSEACAFPADHRIHDWRLSKGLITS